MTILKFVFGRYFYVSADLQELIAETIETGKTRTGMVLNLAMNYGSRAEITRAAQNLAEQVKNGALQPSEITEQMLSDHMYTYGEPDPDLIIRPSGEYRLSIFCYGSQRIPN